MDIGLGSVVVDTTSGLEMVVAAAAGEEMYCVSRDQQKSVRQWRHRSALETIREAERRYG